MALCRYIICFGIFLVINIAAQQDDQTCSRETADLVFVVDSSGSIRESNPDDGSYDNYDLMIQFIIAIVNELDIGPDATQVGVVIFGNTAQNYIMLNEYQNKLQLIDALRRMPYLNENTNTSAGLRLMQSEQFTQNNGDRENVQNVAIVVTDGKSTYDSFRTVRDAEAARSAGTEIIAVGITDEIDEQELRRISSYPQRRGENYFLTASFTDLIDIVFNVLSQRCVSASSGFGEPNVDFCVDDKSDVVFVLDSSGSIRDNNPRDGRYDNWDRMLDFVISVVDTLSIGRDRSRVGVIRYSSEAINHFFLNTYRTRYEIKQAIRNIPYIGSETNTSAALRMLHEDQFRSKNGDRKNAPNVAIVITDGVSSGNPDDVAHQARKARREDDVIMFAIGITNRTNEDELKDISSSPHKKNKNYFLTSDFRTLNDMKIKIECDDKDHNELLYGILVLVVVVFLTLLRLTCAFCYHKSKKYESEDKKPLTADTSSTVENKM